MAVSLKFYTDTHIAKSVALQLRARGVDIVRCEEVGLATASDVTHLEYATREGRTMISHDRDFIDLHWKWQEEGKKHGGIMLVSRKLQGKDMIGHIVKELMQYHELIIGGAGNVETDIADHLIFIGQEVG